MKFGVIKRLSSLMVLTMLSSVGFAADKIDGEVLYVEYCAVCHGENGDGNSRAKGLIPPPRDFTSLHSAIELDRTRIMISITKGRSNTSMVGWEGRLSREEIAALTDYLIENFLKDAKSALPVELAQSIEVGEQLYMENCSVCHGDFGQTGVWTRANMSSAPRNFTADRSLNELSRKRMTESITFGVAGKAMMPYGSRLTNAEIGSIVDYIRLAIMGLDVDRVVAEKATLEGEIQASNKVRAPDAPAFMNTKDFMTQPFPNDLIGDPNEGRKIYVRNCFACHGVKGNGQGPRAFFIKPKPRNFISDDSRRALNRPKIYKAVHDGRPGTVMPAWSKVLSDQEVANAAEFVFRAFIRSDMPGVSEEDLQRAGQKKN
jgi:mono/diheme cytochrome c family protein